MQHWYEAVLQVYEEWVRSLACCPDVMVQVGSSREVGTQGAAGECRGLRRVAVAVDGPYRSRQEGRCRLVWDVHTRLRDRQLGRMFRTDNVASVPH